ncbi:C-type lectin domain family 4 member M-like isoform X2 [Hippocampus comes]|uniref:C-type lectin domain family 4 member M-like isoform X2 n=1 Tax=Hippocampus comes TaxID=109280 RepID=UPI00094ED28D|nr:PREDICTED: C-type lectin domain family 4 member M-like isoform X2 [Hippocampus comes]
MVRFDRREVSVQMDYLNVPQASSKGGTEAVTVHSDSKKEEIATDATCTNSTQETEELKRKISTIDSYGRKGWVYFLSSLYYISSTTRTWFGSRADCLRRGADLVVINSREEQNFVVKFNKLLWIGLKEQEGTWKWVDGSQLKTSYWASNEPNNYEGAKEDCVQIRFHEINNSWNDVICEEEHFWICEKTV